MMQDTTFQANMVSLKCSMLISIAMFYFLLFFGEILILTTAFPPRLNLLGQSWKHGRKAISYLQL